MPSCQRVVSVGHVPYVLVMHQHDVEIIGVGQLAQLVDFLERVHAFARGYLRHQPVGIARNALQRDPQHAVHIAVSLGGLEKADAAVVGVAHEAGELVLPQLALRCDR